MLMMNFFNNRTSFEKLMIIIIAILLLFGIYKSIQVANVKYKYIKNEKNIYPRLLEGLMDTHSFFEKNSPNNMCSYVNDWNMIDILLFRLREIIYVILFYIFRVGLHIDNLLPETWKNDTFIQQHISVFKYIWRDIMLYLTV